MPGLLNGEVMSSFYAATDFRERQRSSALVFVECGVCGTALLSFGGLNAVSRTCRPREVLCFRPEGAVVNSLGFPTPGEQQRSQISSSGALKERSWAAPSTIALSGLQARGWLDLRSW